ncbi:phosphotransferase [Streptomyces megasporus]|uniref:phosphotransferase n=1 Tax=Streptomyces megasporus TaxID=44060 RepID=UPI0004E22A46|nr:phosphotransferase [Streptomyces megasporus]
MRKSAPRQFAIIARRRKTATEVLLLAGPDGWALPHQLNSGLHDVHADIADRLGFSVATLDCVGQDPRFFVHEPVDERPPKEGRWFRAEELPGIALPVPGQRAALHHWLAEVVDDGAAGRPPWTRPGWYSSAVQWALEGLSAAGSRSTGRPEQPGMRAWSRQLRLPAAPRDLYFKASPPVYGHEAAVSLLLSERFPTAVPRVLAVDTRQNWMLTEDFGTVSHSSSPAEAVDAYARMVPELARIQRGMADRADALLSAGCPDHRLKVLPGLYDELVSGTEGLSAAERRRLGGFSETFRSHCAQLAAFGIPQTIVHLDIWRGNHTLTNAGPLIFDWAESVLGHPFVSLDVVLRDLRSLVPGDSGAARRVTNAYLAAWDGAADAGRLAEAVRLASFPGIVSRALLWRDALTWLGANRARPYAATVAAQLRELLPAA